MYDSPPRNVLGYLPRPDLPIIHIIFFLCDWKHFQELGQRLFVTLSHQCSYVFRGSSIEDLGYLPARTRPAGKLLVQSRVGLKFKHPPLASFGDFSCASSAGRTEGQEAHDTRTAPNFRKICAGLNLRYFQCQT
jgi:hypothetical protein